jgi:hypothetical protein
MIIHDKSKSCWICYQVIDHALIDFMEKSQKSLDFGIVPEYPLKYCTVSDTENFGGMETNK